MITANPYWLFRLATILLLALALFVLGPTTVVRGATYTVNSLADPGDGTCDTNECTLREAITAANANSGSADTINFSVTGTINLSSQLPDLTDTAGVTISGTGITLDGGNSIAYGLRSVSTQNNTISGLTLQNFTTVGIEFVTYTSGTDGGHNLQDVTVTNSNIGVRIYNGTGVSISDCTLTDNNTAGIVIEWYSGIPNIDIDGCTIGGNSGDGNGIGIDIANEGADGITIQDNTISYNTTHGIRIFGGADNTTIEGNTITNNGSNQNHYGIFITGAGTNGTQIVNNNTITYNQGHGIALVSGPQNTVIRSNTITNNGQIIVGSYAGSGVSVEGDGTDGTMIGGTDGDQGNAICCNNGNGIIVKGASANGPADTSIIGNAIYQNGQASTNGVGIHIAGVVEDGGDADSYTVVVQSNAIYANFAQGILIEHGGAGSPTNTLIGGTYGSQGNLVYKNGQEGVLIRDNGSNGHVVRGNTIGISVMGGSSSAAAPNNNSGVAITNGAQNNLIEGNDIAYNRYQDLLLSGSGTTGNVVQYNSIDSDSNETPHNYDNSGVVITGAASNNTIGPCNSITDHRFDGILILGDNADNNMVKDNNSNCFSWPSDTAGITGNGRGISIVNNSVSGEAFGRVDPAHGIPGPDNTTVQNNTISSNVGDGVYVKLTSNTLIKNNIINGNVTHGILWVGSTGGSIQGNTISGNANHGLRIEPHYGSSTSPDTASDDHLNGTLRIGTDSPNTFAHNGGSGVYIIDDDIGYTVSQIASNNSFSGNQNQVQQDWLGVVELLVCSGGSCIPITSGQTVTIIANGGSPIWSGSTYDATGSNPALGVWGPSGLDYDDVDTWFTITEALVGNNGALVSYTPHTVTTTGTYNHSGTFSYDGDSTTHSVSPDYGLPFSNDTASSYTGRYQIAQLRFAPTAIELTTLTATVPQPLTWRRLVVVAILSGLGFLLGYLKRR
ncbi:MAG: right-handed parallel beta-helix repeat-containing protein [Anaerolineae bacterium]|nr:right-handed parallel beta-helix repeat-containing protein [Anaerolineae bacterium]MDW8100139.1 right-handed parallel beta-helix repeat-containing protein [Anaerolineae bacterium]